MKGLILKDLIMLKKQWISLTVMIVAFSISAIFGDVSFAVVLSVIMSILPINLMSLDEQSRFQQYAITLPYGRKTIVTSKYCFYIMDTLASMVFLTLICIISSIIKPETEISIPTMLVSGLIAGNIYPLIMLPLVFKFNSATGRTILIIISMIFGGIIGATTSMVVGMTLDGEINISDTLVNIFSSPLMGIIVIAVLAVLYLISWAISVKIYEKRDL